MSDLNADLHARRIRDRISALDRAILESVNARIDLVVELKAYKDARGLDFHDPDREASILEDLARVNRGPLSRDGLIELHRELLALTKREVGRAAEPD